MIERSDISGAPPADEEEIRALVDIQTQTLGFPRREDSDWIAGEGIENVRIAKRGGERRALAHGAMVRGPLRARDATAGARRMCDVAANITDAILPSVPVRQWVLSL